MWHGTRRTLTVGGNLKKNMMKNNLFISVFILISCLITNGQEIIDKKYYKNKYQESANTERQKRVVELTIKEPDGTIRYEMRKTKNDEILRVRSYKNGIPVGTWITIAGHKFDYDFELKYTDSEYQGILQYDLDNNTLKNDVDGEFVAPIFTDYGNNFRTYVSKNLMYPAVAQERGLQGKVISQFIIDEQGNLTDFSILKSADKILDKEAARVILNSAIWKPARLNGKPIKVHIIFPTSFIMN